MCPGTVPVYVIFPICCCFDLFTAKQYLLSKSELEFVYADLNFEFPC